MEAKEQRGGGGGGQAAIQPRRGKRLDLDHVDFRQNEIEEVRNLIGVLESVVLISLKKLSDENFLNPITNFLYSILKSLAGVGGITIPKPPPCEIRALHLNLNLSAQSAHHPLALHHNHLTNS